ncbi:MAG: aminotransferase class IV [Elusimicrobia bacterium]|nr:aminotransferase class IV [Elusimicrobiota bacterium]
METIKIEAGIPCNISFHNLRLNNSRKELFGCRDFIKLENIIKIPLDMKSGLYKCRLIYSDTIKKLEFLPYHKRKIKCLKVVVCNGIEYNYKYENRECLNELLELKQNCDDILLVKNKKITDTSFSNVVFFDGKKWITPSTPLLKGTKREKLLSEKKIVQDEIKTSDLKYFQKAALINSMLDLTDNIIKIENNALVKSFKNVTMGEREISY